MKNYIKYYNESYNTVLDTVIGSPEEEDAYELTKEFVTDRLSDLQQMDENDFNFQFTSFIVTNAGIGDVKVLPQFKYLKNIELKTNMVGDMAPLQELKYLVSINLSENRIASIDGLAFEKLETLVLEGNQICYLNNFAAPKLKVLDLSKNKIFFIATDSLKKCPLLEELNLSTNAIRTVKENALSGLVHLKTLKIDSNSIETLDNIICDDMKEVSDVDISGTQVNDLSALAKLPKLEVLDVHGLQQISAVDAFIPLQNLEHLLYLYIYETTFAGYETSRIEVIHYLQHLEEIDEKPVTFAEKEESASYFEDSGEKQDQEVVEEED